ncbi:MAG: hypothetical protein II567_00395 [Candidatus Riflebacteria bacterium]|nr:hypothetical protein [Candidatus Riflebacteria bacterium]
MKKKLIIVCAIMAVALTLSIGCGSSSGTGRYSVPSDIISGGGGSGHGSGGSGGGGIVETDVDSLIASGWEDFRYGAYSSAISKFNEALLNSGISDSQKASAYNGLGWALTKSSGSESGYSAFTQASGLNDEAKIGLAAALMQRGTKTACQQAASLLESLGLKETSTVFTAIHPIGVTNAGAHAMLAWCYFIIGNEDGARTQITFARAADGTADSAVNQIYNSLIAMGLTFDN